MFTSARTVQPGERRLTAREQENLARLEREERERESRRPSRLDAEWARQLPLKRLADRTLVTSDPLVRPGGLPDGADRDPEKRVRGRTNGSDVTETSNEGRELIEKCRSLVRRLKDGRGLEKKYWWSQYWLLVGLLEELMPEPRHSRDGRQAALRKCVYGTEEWKRRDRERCLARNKRRRSEPRRRASETDRMFEARVQTWLERREADASRKRKKRSGRTDAERRADSEAAKLRVRRSREKARAAAAPPSEA